MSKVAQNVLEEFGAAVLRARSLKGWQLKDLTNAMVGNSGISFLSDIEKGKRSISPPTVGKLIKALELDEAWIDRFIGSDATEDAETTRADRVADAALEQSEVSGATERLRSAGITENALIILAQRIAADTEDVGQAWVELQNAMDLAERVQAEGRVKSNHGDFVDTVLERVAELARDGEYASAGAAIDEALAREETEHQARKVRLIESGVEVALLNRDTAKAAALLVRKADMEAAGFAEFGELRQVWISFYENGRDKGINLDLELAIDLAELIRSRASGSTELGTALNDLGVGLKTLGERETGTARLDEAVIAYKAALEKRTQDKVPLYWALTKENMAVLEQERFGKTPDPSYLDAALQYALEAQDVYVEAGASFYIERIERVIAEIRLRKEAL